MYIPIPVGGWILASEVLSDGDILGGVSLAMAFGARRKTDVFARIVTLR